MTIALRQHLHAAGGSRRRLLVATLLAAVGPAGLAEEPSWPSRPIRIVVGYPPGGVSDAIARALADRLTLELGTPVLVEHRPGAGGGVAMAALARSAPDGYTLCFSAVSPLTLAPHLGPVHYDPLNDIAAVGSVMFTPVLLLGTRALGADSLAAALALARQRPGSLRWATSGLGTTGHMVLEQVRRASGTDITHVPYKGGGAQLNDALSGHFELLSSNVGALQIDYIRRGRLVPLAVGAPSRLPVLADVPTLAELGFPQANLVSLFGIFATGRTPGAIVTRLNAALNKALALPEIHDRLLAVNNVPAGGSAAEFAARIARESLANRRLIEDGMQRR